MADSIMKKHELEIIVATKLDERQMRAVKKNITKFAADYQQEIKDAKIGAEIGIQLEDALKQINNQLKTYKLEPIDIKQIEGVTKPFEELGRIAIEKFQSGFNLNGGTLEAIADTVNSIYDKISTNVREVTNGIVNDTNNATHQVIKNVSEIDAAAKRIRKTVGKKGFNSYANTLKKGQSVSRDPETAKQQLVDYYNQTEQSHKNNDPWEKQYDLDIKFVDYFEKYIKKLGKDQTLTDVLGKDFATKIESKYLSLFDSYLDKKNMLQNVVALKDPKNPLPFVGYDKGEPWARESTLQEIKSLLANGIKVSGNNNLPSNNPKPVVGDGGKLSEKENQSLKKEDHKIVEDKKQQVQLDAEAKKQEAERLIQEEAIRKEKEEQLRLTQAQAEAEAKAKAEAERLAQIEKTKKENSRKSYDVYRGIVDEGENMSRSEYLDMYKGEYWTTSKKVAKTYAYDEELPGAILVGTVNPKNPLVVDAEGKSYEEIKEIESLVKLFPEIKKGIMSPDEVQMHVNEAALNMGYDAVVMNNVRDDLSGNGELTTTIAALKDEIVSLFGAFIQKNGKFQQKMSSVPSFYAGPEITDTSRFNVDELDYSDDIEVLSEYIAEYRRLIDLGENISEKDKEVKENLKDLVTGNWGNETDADWDKIDDITTQIETDRIKSPKELATLVINRGMEVPITQITENAEQQVEEGLYNLSDLIGKDLSLFWKRVKEINEAIARGELEAKEIGFASRDGKTLSFVDIGGERNGDTWSVSYNPQKYAQYSMAGHTHPKNQTYSPKRGKNTANDLSPILATLAVKDSKFDTDVLARPRYTSVLSGLSTLSEDIRTAIIKKINIALTTGMSPNTDISEFAHDAVIKQIVDQYKKQFPKLDYSLFSVDENGILQDITQLLPNENDIKEWMKHLMVSAKMQKLDDDAPEWQEYYKKLDEYEGNTEWIARAKSGNFSDNFKIESIATQEQLETERNITQEKEKQKNIVEETQRETKEKSLLPQAGNFEKTSIPSDDQKAKVQDLLYKFAESSEGAKVSINAEELKGILESIIYNVKDASENESKVLIDEASLETTLNKVFTNVLNPQPNDVEQGLWAREDMVKGVLEQIQINTSKIGELQTQQIDLTPLTEALSNINTKSLSINVGGESNDAKKEIYDMTELEKVIQKVTEAVRKKTEAFVLEEQQVTQGIGKEISALVKMESELQSIVTLIGQINTFAGKTVNVNVNNKNAKVNKDGTISYGKASGESGSMQKTFDYYYWLEEQMEQFKNNAKYVAELQKVYDSITPKIVDYYEKNGGKSPEWMASLNEKHNLHMSRIRGGEEYSDSISVEQKTLDILKEEYRLKKDIFSLEQQGATNEDLKSLHEKLGIYQSIRETLEYNMSDDELTRYATQASKVQSSNERQLTVNEIKANIKARKEEIKILEDEEKIAEHQRQIEQKQKEAEVVKQLVNLYKQLGEAQARGDINEASRIRGDIKTQRGNVSSIDYATDMKFRDARKKGFEFENSKITKTNDAENLRKQNEALKEQENIINNLDKAYKEYGALKESAGINSGTALGKQLENEAQDKLKEIQTMRQELQTMLGGNISSELNDKFDKSQKAGQKAEADKSYRAMAKKDDVDEETRKKKILSLEKEIAKIRAEIDETSNTGVKEALEKEIELREELIKLQKQGQSMDEVNEAYQRKRLSLNTKQAKKEATMNARETKKVFEDTIKDSRNRARVNEAGSVLKKGTDVLSSTWRMESISESDISNLSEIQKLQDALKELDVLKQKIDNDEIVDPQDAAELQSLTHEVIKQSEAVQSLINNYERFNDENSKSLGKTLSGDDVKQQLTDAANAAHNGKIQIQSYNETTQELTYTVKTGAHEFTEFTAGVRQGDKALREIQRTTKRTESFLDTIKRKTREISTYLLGSASIGRVIGELKKGITYVREIDSALTELKKVTDETEETYDRFLETAGKTAGKVGSTVKEIVSSTADWARLNI